jgi:hypothetical protein
VNVLHGIKQVGFGTNVQDVATGLASDLGDFWSPSTLRPMIGTTVALSEVGIRDLNEANQAEYNATTSLAGGSATGPLPPGVAMCCTLRTAKAGKSYRGRYYQGGFTEGYNDATGQANAAVATALEEWVTDLQEAFNGRQMTLAVASRTLGTSEPVTAVQVRDRVWDTQRRRAVAGI